METLFKTKVEEGMLGVLYLCTYNYRQGTLHPTRELVFDDAMAALDSFANIHNPASQLAMGKTTEELKLELDKLHKNMQDPAWCKGLGEYL